MAFLRTLLILGRVSNLPTVWSNCLAAWWLGGGGSTHLLPWLLVGSTFLYVGGMFLNDAFDAAFDRQHRAARPIPSGAIAERVVWICGFAWLLLGLCCFIFLGWLTAGLALGLVLCIVLYDATHKALPAAPILMGACRFLLYLVAASTGVRGIGLPAISFGLALAGYIVGLSYLARRESASGTVSLRFWPLLLLGGPMVAALLVHGASEGPLLLSLVLALWGVRCLRYTFWGNERDIGRTVSGLLAGIVLVDWLAASQAPRELGYVFIALFLSALLFQRSVPAT